MPVGAPELTLTNTAFSVPQEKRIGQWETYMQVAKGKRNPRELKEEPQEQSDENQERRGD